MEASIKSRKKYEQVKEGKNKKEENIYMRKIRERKKKKGN